MEHGTKAIDGGLAVTDADPAPMFTIEFDLRAASPWHGPAGWYATIYRFDGGLDVRPADALKTFAMGD